jgi:uncharacterized protein YkwD
MLAAFLFAATLAFPASGHCDAPAAHVVVDGVNARRAEANVLPLTVDEALTAVAEARAADLARRHYFAHVSPDGTTAIDVLRNRDVRFSYAGENLANAETVRAAELGLWESPDHRENIVESHYRRVGIAVFRTPNDGLYLVQIFAD